jgi:hypothetical protein
MGNETFVIAELVEAQNSGMVEDDERWKGEVGEAFGRLKEWFGNEEVEKR